MYAIYALCDPDEPDTVFYVGFTANVEQQLKDHCKYPEIDSPKSQWIQKLRDKNSKPVCKVIEENIPTEAEARFREAFWIYRYKRLNMPLTNVPVNFSRAAQLYESLDHLRSCGEPS